MADADQSGGFPHILRKERMFVLAAKMILACGEPASTRWRPAICCRQRYDPVFRVALGAVGDLATRG